MRLGHCICNPRQACPCDLLREKNLCPCAGERLETGELDVPLTSLVESPGCASKISQGDLRRVLAGLPVTNDPRVLVGTNTCDDAGVFQVREDLALVQTVDVFTPNVDDAYTFGQIAAANSLSDVYAMGGQPLSALAIMAFPIERLSHRLMAQIIRGGLDKLAEAGVPVVGGHSVKDQEIKFGYAVTGTVHPAHIITNAGAQPGDVLLLTKPLGTGVISFAAQIGRASETQKAAITAAMTQLNKAGSELMVAAGAHAATDVTGFGLMGHLVEMALGAGVNITLDVDQVPCFPGVLELLADGVVAGGIERNLEYSGDYQVPVGAVSEARRLLLYDPQTSGGLLIAVAAEAAEALILRLQEAGYTDTVAIGRVADRSAEPMITLRGDHTMNDTNPKQQVCCASGAEVETELEVELESCCASTSPASPSGTAAPTASCCAGASGASGFPALDGTVGQRFGAFMGAASAAGALSLPQKELITLALALLARCEPCLKLHLAQARAAGCSEAEIAEALWLAVAMGGAPLLAFYNALNDGG